MKEKNLIVERLNNLAVQQMQKKQYVQAEQNLKKSIRLNSVCGVAYYNLGTIYFHKRKDKYAEKYFKKAIRCYKSRPRSQKSDLYVKLGATYFFLSDFKKAHYYLNRSIKMGKGKDNEMAYYYKARIFYINGLKKKALGYIKKSLKYNSKDKDYLNLLFDINNDL